MNKLFSFAKYAGIVILALMVLEIVLSFAKLNSAWLNIAVSFLIDATWVVFFILLIKSSAKYSPVVAPSWIAFAAFISAFFSSCSSSLASSLFNQPSYDWEKVSTLFSVSTVAHIVCLVCIIVGFIWLSVYFQKRSLVKWMCILIPVGYILIQIFNWTVLPSQIDDAGSRDTLLTFTSIAWPLIRFIPQSLFLLAFSKLNKS